MIPPVDLSLATIDQLTLPLLQEKKLEAVVLRLDKIHPLISGNKWFKLKYYFEEARSQNKKHMVTFGGAWSNHLLATAAACRQNGFESTGIVRGEEPSLLSSTLQQCRQMGMHLVFSSREEYRLKKIPDDLAGPDFYLVPEGGYGYPGAAGAATIAELFPSENFSQGRNAHLDDPKVKTARGAGIPPMHFTCNAMWIFPIRSSGRSKSK